MVFVYVHEGDYGALTILIGAREFVRKQKVEENPSSYLLGTPINVSIALLLFLGLCSS